MSYPTIGLAVPTFNRPHYLAILLRSVPDDIPVAVSDNGGSLPEEVIAEFPLVQFVPTSTVLEPLRNWNVAARLQTSEWVAIPGDDDVYETGAFTIVERNISAHPDADMFVFGHNIIDQNGVRLSTWSPNPDRRQKPAGFEQFKFGVDARMPSIFFRKSLFERLNGFDEGFRITAGDSDFLQRATLIGNCHFVPDIVSSYRVWQGGTTAKLISTPGWMRDVETWCNSVKQLDADLGLGMYSNKIRDEIVLRNIVGGLAAVKPNSTFASRIGFLRQHPIPKRGQLRSYLRLVKMLLG